ncbi:hypothetical protein [Nannocystis radixulma]|uniref:Uncharacterized protein n=1 Tax=Nannocystis radixulma TaxID=2995305 RepID=A0ABT5B4L2_9BACT|nr:hypothetical protein [Nannocystis radixulma]MDC0669031.1 hypothetical protein [Nannocystis radixulma]
MTGDKNPFVLGPMVDGTFVHVCDTAGLLRLDRMQKAAGLRVFGPPPPGSAREDRNAPAVVPVLKDMP